MKTFYSLIILLVFTLASPLLAQEVSLKAAKYYEILKKRPTPGYLYDRFYNTWLDTDTIEGLEAYLRAEVDKENSTGSRLILAFFFTKQGDNVKAIEQFQLALEKDPGNAETLHQMAVVESRTLNFDAAIEHLEKASKANPKPDVEREILQMLGKLHARNGNRDKAMEAWKRLLDRNADDENLREDLIELQIIEGMWAEALATARQLQESTKDPYKAVLRRLRIGDIHQRSGDREKALDEYSASLDKVGSGTWLEKEIYSQIEQVFRREDDINGLRDHYKKLLGVYPKRIVLRRQYADLLAELGETESALETFEEILALTPGDRKIREDYISMLDRLDKKDEAAKQLTELIKLHPTDAELEIRRAELANGLDKKEEARRALDAFIEKSDKSEYAYLRVARLLEGIEEKDATEDVFKKLLAAFPDSEGARDAYAAYLHRVDRKVDAVGIWEGMAKDGDRSQVVRIARGLASRGENAAAMELLESRYADFSADAVYLQQLVTQALHLKRYESALPWARQLVRLAKNPLDLETAVDLAVKTVRAAEKSNEWIQLLEKAQLPQEKCLMAELLEKIGDSEAATAVLQTIEESEPLLATTQLIRLQRQRGDWGAAAEAAVRLAEMPGGRRSANVQKVVELYQRGGNLEDALKWIPEWKKLSPGSTLPWISEMRLLLDQGKSKEAIGAMRRAMQEFEGNEDVRAVLAQLYADEGQLADSSRIYMQLYEEAKDVSAKIRWVGMLAQAMEMRGKSQTLVERFEERRRNNRNSIVPLLALAEIHRASNNYEERRKAMMEATRIKSDDLDLLHEIARIEASEEDYERALTTLRTALPLDKTNKTRERMARLHFNNGNEDEGFSILREIAGGNNIDAKAAEALGQAIVSSRNFEKGADFLIPLLEKFPGNYRLRYLYCICLEEAGREMEAARAFARIVEINQELPGHQQTVTATMQSVRNPYMEDMRDLLPDTAFDLINITQYQYQAYSYRNNGRTWTPGGHYLPAGTVSLPPDLKAAHFAALGHLMTIGGQLSDQEKKELSTDLRQSGFTDADVYLDLDIQILNQGRFDTILALHPNNETIRALAVLYAQNQSSLELTELDSLCRSFEKTRPKLAAAGALSAILLQDDDEQATALIEWGIEKTLEIEDPGYFLANAIIRCLHQAKDTDKLSAETKSKLGKHLLEVYERNGRSGPWGASLFSSVATTLADEKDYTPLIAFLESEIDHYHKSLKEGKSTQSGSNAYNPYSRGYRNQSKIVQPLVFPNVTLENFPPPLSGALLNNNNSMFFGRVRFDQEQLQAALGSVRSPYLKLFLANICEAEDVVRETVAGLIQDKEPDLDAYLMSAAYAATENDDRQGAVKLLQKAQFLPMTRDLRQTIDGSVVSWVIAELDINDAEQIPEMFEAGKAAALRLRRVRLAPNQRTELAAAMEELGLGKEAEKLVAQAHVPAGPQGGTFPSVAPQSSGSRVEKLMAKGKRREALRLLETDLRRFSSQGLTSHSAFSNTYEIRKWSDLVAGTGLRKDLVKAIDPGETANPKRLAQHAFGLEVLGEEDRAIEAYKKALALRERDDGVRLRLLRLLMARNDATESMKLLKGLDARQIATLGPQMQNFIHQDEIPAEQRLRMVGQVADFVSALKDTENVDLSWFDNLVEFVAGITYDNSINISIEPLYAVYANSNGNQDEDYIAQQEKLRTQRRQTYDHLCETMLKIPQCARQGFYRLSGLRLHEGAKEQDIENLAIKAVEIHEPAKAHRLQGGVVFGGRYNRDQNSIPMWYPEQFMIKAAWRRGDLNSVEEKLLKPLRESKNRNLRLNAETLETYADLYFCEKDDFLKTIEVYLRKNNNSHMGLDHALWSDVVDVWVERDLEIDISTTILKQMERATGQNWGNQPAFLSKYCRKLVDEKGIDALNDFLVRMTTACLKAEPSEWGARIKKEYSPRSVSGGTFNARIHQYLGWLSAASNDEKIFWILLDFYEEHLEDSLGAMGSSGRLNFHSHALLQYESVYRDFDGGVALLKNSPFLNPVESYRSYSKSNGSSHNSLLQQVGYRIRSAVANQNRKELLNKYTSFFKETGTFGAGMMAIQLENTDRDKKLSTYLLKHSDAIDLAPEKVQKDLSALASIEIRENVMIKLPAEEKAYLEKLQGLTKDDIDAEIERVMNAKKLSDLQVEDHRLDEKTQRILKYLLDDKADPARAKALLEKVSALVDKARLRGLWSRNYQNSSFEAYVLNNLLSQNRTVGILGFVLDEVEDPSNEKRNYSYPRSYDQEYVFRNLISKLPEGPKKESVEDKQKRQLVGIIETLQAQIDPKHIPAMASGLNGILRSYGGNIGKQLDALLEQFEEISDPKLQPYVRTMEMWYRMYLVANDSKVKEQEKQSVNKYFQEILDNEQASVSGRTALAAELLRYYRKGLSESTRQKCLDRLEGAVQAKSPVLEQTLVYFLDPIASVKTEDRDEAWRTEASRVLKLAGVHTFRRQPTGARSPNNNITQALLTLSLDLEDGEILNQVLRHTKSDVKTNWIGMMITSDNEDVARRLLAKHWQNLDWRVHSSNLRYNLRLHEKIAPFCESIENEDLRAFTRAMLESVANDPNEATGDKKPGYPSRKERMTALAKSLKAESFGNVIAEEAVLSFIAEEPEAANLIQERFKRLGQNLSPTSLEQNNNAYRKAQKTKIYQTFLGHQLLESTDTFYQSLQELGQLKFRSSYQREEAANGMASILEKAFNAGFNNWDEATRNRNLKLWRDMLSMENAARLFDDSLGNWTAYAIAAHAVAGQSEELHKVWDSIKDDVRRKVEQRHYYFSRKLLETLNALIAKPQEMGSEKRLAIFEAVYSDPFAVALYMKGGREGNRPVQNAQTVFENYRRANWITADELLVHGPRWMETNHRMGFAALELAGAQLKKNENEAVIATYKFGLEVCGEEAQLPYTNLILGLTRKLHDLKRRDEAFAVIEKADSGRIQSNSRDKYQHLLRESQLWKLAGDKPAVDFLKEAGKRFVDEGDGLQSWIEMAQGAQALGRRYLEADNPEEAETVLELAAVLFAKTNPGNAIQFTSQIDELVEARHASGRWPTEMKLIEKGAEWKYFDQGKIPAENWMAKDYDAGTWKSGNAEFGYGDEDEETIISFGPDSKNKYVTTYFQKTFEVSGDTDIQRLFLHIKRDDGSVVYVNGTELIRGNLPDGEIGYSTSAEKTISSSQERNGFGHSLTSPDIVARAAIQPGKNVIAVEVHQHAKTDAEGNQSVTSSDCSFDLSLSANAYGWADVMPDRLRKGLAGRLGALHDSLPAPVQKYLAEMTPPTQD